MRTRSHHIAAAALSAFLLVAEGSAQAPAPGPGASPTQAAPPVSESVFDQALRTATVAEERASLSYANRQIVEFRATVLSRTPAERASGAKNLLDRLVDEVPWGRAAVVPIADARLITIDKRSVF